MVGLPRGRISNWRGVIADVRWNKDGSISNSALVDRILQFGYFLFYKTEK